MFQVSCDNVFDKYGEQIWTNSREDLQYTYQETFPPEKAFRGFEITPKVLCERIDITAYLNKQKMKNLLKPIQQCSVILVREDLERLKKTYNNHINSQKKCLKYTNAHLRKCNVCEKVYKSETRLKNHIETKHTIVNKKSRKRVTFSDEVIVHELKEYHYCIKCPKVYEDYQTLKTHMKLVHKKQKCYICFYCNKEFFDRMFFKVHIKMHCNVCGLFFVNRNLYNDHRRTVCRILKKYNCKTCNETYFSFLSLKDHSYDHEGDMFVCDICKERCNSKCQLLHHIQFLHSKKQPKTLYDTEQTGTSVKYKCNSCDHCSNNKELIVNHTISLPDLKNSLTTGYNNYYFCDQCSEQFDTETKMLRHKWTHFLDTKNNERHKNNILQMPQKTKEELPVYLQPKLVLDKLKIDNLKTSYRALNEVAKSNVTWIDTINSVKGNISTYKTTPSCSNTSFNYSIVTESEGIENMKNIEVIPSKPVVDPRTKKTIISKHQCLECRNYFSSGYCLRRHISSIHNKHNAQCSICEEVFVWPSLIKSHNCIRMTIPETPFEYARSGMQFYDPYSYIPIDDGMPLDDMNTSNDMDYNTPAPIVQLTEYDYVDLIVSNEGGVSLKTKVGMNIDNMDYVITVQEVPIEF